ncbi:BMP family lipoprotein [Agrococcus sp. SGAir0287]|uniref:BMP family lipoprotein n=1 Tax=Agrococcus sp. SGAir0287 TaxID=2070347 RepID=UPI0010CCDCCC|nr:BMP family ABC transporter substrate-binding protein [Agrococcus sp. SGAir0287]QCR18623.1 BMP family ABC transporter substrate-binding protein [Agrococcus sp. SGAir0287]
MSRTALRLAAPVALVALALTACQAAPEGDGDGAGAAASDLCAQMVTNSGGLEDRSFNQASWAGMEQAEEDYGVEVNVLVSTSESDLAPNVEAAVGTGCDFVLTVGYELAAATADQAEANPDVQFAIVDEVVEAPNVRPIVFDTAQASFLAGYLAAGVSQTGVVATFGGGNQPPVTLFMDGYVQGVDAYNAAHGTSVQVLGWDVETQDGIFTGDFENVQLGQATAQSLIAQGADVILPVAGQVGEGAFLASLDAGSEALVIWVDSDGYETLPDEYHPLLLTTVEKNTQDFVVQAIGDLVDEQAVTDEPLVGTLENEGVGLAEYHDLSPRVSDELQGEIDALREQIVSGELVVESPSAP